MPDNKILIAGAGASGITCAIYLARAGFDVDVYSDEERSVSCLSEAPSIENYPGFPDGISGFELLGKFTEQAVRNGVKIHPEGIEKASGNTAVDTSGNSHHYDEFVMAVGLKPREFVCEGSDTVTIHTCAVCDAGLYGKDSEVIVIGGGDTAFGDALYLANLVKTVHIISRRTQYRVTSSVALDKVKSSENIIVHSPCNIAKLSMRESRITAELDNGESLTVDGIFSCIGYEPNSIDADGDVYRCGDCIEKHHQVSVAVGSGASTALEIIEKYKASR